MNISCLKIIIDDDSNIQVQVYIDISDFIIGAVLLQKENKCFHLIVYYS